eukprot:12485-Heterococcus_DN1.PRE.2
MHLKSQHAHHTTVLASARCRVHRGTVSALRSRSTAAAAAADTADAIAAAAAAAAVYCCCYSFFLPCERLPGPVAGTGSVALLFGAVLYLPCFKSSAIIGCRQQGVLKHVSIVVMTAGTNAGAIHCGRYEQCTDAHAPLLAASL